MSIQIPRMIPGYAPAVLLALNLVFGSIGQAEAAWKPARAEKGPARVKLGTETDPGPTYFKLAVGDTAVFLISGEGRLRIKSRPATAGQQGPEIIRLGVGWDSEDPRKFKRRTHSGKEDVLDLEIPPGTRRIAVFNRNRDGRVIHLRTLFKGNVTQPRKAARQATHRTHRLEIRLDLLQRGYNDNTARTPKNGTGRTEKLFWPVRAEAAYRNRPAPDWRLDASYVFKGRIYQNDLYNQLRHRVKLEQRWQGSRDTWASPLTVKLTEGLSAKNATFFGRGDSVAMETITGTGDLVSLADRFNSVTLNVAPTLEWELSPTLDAWGEFTCQSRNYTEDYENYNDIYALDFDSKKTALGLDWTVNENLDLDANWSRADKQYDEKYSRDEFGVSVSGVAANYVKSIARVQGRWGLRTGLQVGAEIKYYRNSDQYQGYWDYNGLALGLTGGWRWAKGHAVSLEVRRSETEYDRSHVDNDGSLPLRHKDVVNVRLDGRWVWRPGVLLVLNHHYKDYDYNSQLFAYTRSLSQIGVRAEF